MIQPTKSRLALRPDLDQCLLEDRALLAGASSPFYTLSGNSLVVPTYGTAPGLGMGSNSGSGSSSGSSSGPSTSGPSMSAGPQFYYYIPGSNFMSPGVMGLNIGGGTLSGFGNVRSGSASALRSSGGSGGGGGGGGDSNGTGGAGGLANLSGYGANISSGFSFALSSQNNYGINAFTLGSVPVHTYGGGGDMQDAPKVQDPAASEGGQDSGMGMPNLVPGFNVRDILNPPSTLGNKLLGKSLGGMNLLPNGPAQMGP